MAYLFDDASSEYMQRDSTTITNEPLTLAAWFNTNDVSIHQQIMWIGDKDVDNMYWYLAVRGDVAGDPVQAGTRGTSTRTADTTTGATVNTWHHACATFSGDTDRTAYIDGGSSANDTASATVTGADRMSIGAARRSSPFGYFSGLIAECAVWNVVLTAAEVAILAAGYSPLFVRPQSLINYWDLIHHPTTPKDLIDGTAITRSGADPAAHPRIIYPLEARNTINITTVGGGGDDGFISRQFPRGVLRGVMRGVA